MYKHRVFHLSLFLIGLLLSVDTVLATPSTTHTLTATTAFDGTFRRIRVPILMYHYVSELPEDADDIRRNLTVSPTLFAAHAQYLSEQGYTTISMEQLQDALDFGAPLPDRPVILTFDDGHIDHYTHVFPILLQYGQTATFFIITGFADQNLPDYLSWTQITEMASAGMQMESHTKTHSSMAERGYDFLIYEIVGSIESLAHYTGNPPRMFAYPAGRYDQTTLHVLRTTGIQLAVTTRGGIRHTTDGRLELPRLRITNETGTAGLAYLLAGAGIE